MFKKIVLVGSTGAGKTSLCIKLSTNRFHEEGPTIYRNANANVVCYNQVIRLSIFDTEMWGDSGIPYVYGTYEQEFVNKLDRIRNQRQETEIQKRNSRVIWGRLHWNSLEDFLQHRCISSLFFYLFERDIYGYFRKVDGPHTTICQSSKKTSRGKI